MTNPVAPFWPGLVVEAKESARSRATVTGRSVVKRVLLDEEQRWWIQLSGVGFAFARWFSADDFRVVSEV